MKGNNAPTAAGRGKVIFIREGCGWCHTMLPEQTQDWTYFGAPPLAVDVQLESPSLFGSDRKAPDLLHIASRNRVKAWHYVHHRDPRAVTPGSIMPAFLHLTDEELDAIVAFLESLK
jgi:cytochrome c oxidase cbb3-type subunit 2